MANYLLPQYQHGSTRKRAITLVAFLFVAFLYGLFIALTFPFLAVQATVPILLLGLFVVWALPDRAEIKPPKYATILFFALFVTISVWPVYLSISLPSLPWISAARLFGSTLFILTLIRVASSREVRARLSETFAASRVPAIFLAAFVIIQMISAIVGTPTTAGLNRFLDAIFLWWGALIAAVLLFQSERVTSRWDDLFCVLTSASAVLCLVEVWNGKILWADLLFHLPKFVSVDPDFLQGLLQVPAWGAYRAKGVFTNSLSFAEFMALGSCFLAVRLFGARSTGEVVRYGVLNVLVLAGLIYNGSRLGVVGATAGYATAGLLVVYRRWRENPGSIVASAALYFTPLIIAFAVTVFLFVGRIRKLFVGSGIQVTSTEARIEQFDKLPGPLFRRPVFGYGPGNGAEALDYHQPGGLLTVDTYVISLLLDYGILGFVAFTGFLVSLFVIAVRLSLNLANSRYLLTAALAATLMAFLVIRLVLSQEDNHTLFFFLVGLVFAEKYRSDRAKLTN